MPFIRNISRWIFSPPYDGVPWIIWFYAVICCLMVQQGGVFSGELTGYDDHTRMAQVLDWVNGAGWYDRIIHRVNAPEGFQTIWSRLVDLPFAIVIMTLQGFIGQRPAALVSSFAIPLAELALLLVIAVPYFARPILGESKARLMALFAMFTTVMNFKSFSVSGFHTGEVSHHSWYIILGLFLFGAIARMVLGVGGHRPALFAGAVTSLLLSVGIEAYALIAVAFSVTAFLSWYTSHPRLAKKSCLTATTGAVGSLLLLPTHQPPSHWLDVSFAEPSIFGPLVMVVAVIFFIIENFILKRLIKNKFLSFVCICLTALLMVGGILISFPALLQGPAAALSPEERTMAFREHAEAMPLLYAASSVIDFISLSMPLLIALIAFYFSFKNSRNSRRRAVLITYGGFTALTTGMADLIARFYHHALLISCAGLSLAWAEFLQRLRRNCSYALRGLGAFVMIGPFWMLLLPALVQDEPVTAHVLLYPAKVQFYIDVCSGVRVGSYLNQHYSPQTVLNVPGILSSHMLLYSDLRIDFLNNYPSQNKFIDNEVFFGTQDLNVARDIAARHDFDLVGWCRITNTSLPLAKGEEPMLYERLEFGQPPKWLRPVKMGIQGFLLYEVDKIELHREIEHEHSH